MTQPPKSAVCVICGTKPATTKDHIPPKSIFSKPYPSNLITVPACFGCNNSGGRSDEVFAALLGIQLTRHPDAQAQRIFSEKTIKILKRKPELRNMILSSAMPVYVPRMGAPDQERAYAVKTDRRNMDRTIARITRGLYFHETGQILGATSDVEVAWRNDDPAQYWPPTLQTIERNVGGVFKYRYAIVPQEQLFSMWTFRIYDNSYAIVLTSPAGYYAQGLG